MNILVEHENVFLWIDRNTDISCRYSIKKNWLLRCWLLNFFLKVPKLTGRNKFNF